MYLCEWGSKIKSFKIRHHRLYVKFKDVKSRTTFKHKEFSDNIGSGIG